MRLGANEWHALDAGGSRTRQCLLGKEAHSGELVNQLIN